MQNNGVASMPGYCSILGQSYTSGYQLKLESSALKIIFVLRIFILFFKYFCLCRICNLDRSFCLCFARVRHWSERRRRWRPLKRQNSSDRKFSHERRLSSDYVTNGRATGERIKWNGWDISITAAPRNMDLMTRGILRQPPQWADGSTESELSI